MHGGFTSALVDCISGFALMTHKTQDAAPVIGVSVDLHITLVYLHFYFL